MSESSGPPEGRVPNAGQGVNDSTEPEEEYELDQARDERDGHGGESLSERLAEGREDPAQD
jgi:hypothetical protein